MKAAVVALVCVLRFAVTAQAAEAARADPAQASPVLAPAAAMPAPPLAQPAPTTREPAREPAKPRADAGRRQRVCLNAAETRETVAAHRLTEPFRALRVGGQQGEALRAKLCKWRKDEFVYEISVLRRDGRILHLYMNAQSGQAVGALDDNDRN